MLQLSTPSTSFYYVRPKSLPILVVGFIAVFDVVWVVNSHANPRIPLWDSIGIPLFVSGMGYVGIKAFKKRDIRSCR